MIKAVVFDFRDTILDIKKSYEQKNLFLWGSVKGQGVKINYADFLTLFKDCISQVIKKMAGNTNVHDWNPIFIKKLFDNLGLKIASSELVRILQRHDKIFINNAKVYPDARDILEYLKRRRIKMAVVIDGTVKRETAIIRRLKLAKYFNAVIISESVRKNKFTSRPLALALKKLAVAHANVLVVGDRIDKDIVHANKLGCVSVKLERQGGRYKNLKALNSKETPSYVVKELNVLKKLIA